MDKPIRPEISDAKRAEFEAALGDMPQLQSYDSINRQRKSLEGRLLEAEIANIRAQLSASQARIKASQEQEPRLRYVVGDSGYRFDWIGERPDWESCNLYAQPPIPPDVEALKRDYQEAKEECTALRMGWDEKIRENAELRKLLEAKVLEDALFKVVEVAHMAGQRNQGHCDPSAYEALVYWNMYKLQILDSLGIQPQPPKEQT